MAFQTKDFISITAGMLNWARAVQKRVTDFFTGALARTLLEAAAVEIDELYQQMLNGLTEAIPASLYLTFGFPPLPSIKATGIVTFFLDDPAPSNVLIAAGTQVTNDDGSKIYKTLVNATILSGQTSISTDVRALEAGAFANCGVGDITVVLSGPPGVQVTNAAPIISGADAETPDQRNQRFQTFLASLSRGPLGALEYGATTARLMDAQGVIVERVVEAVAVEKYKVDPTAPLGIADVYIYNGGSGASVDLVDRAQEIMDGYMDGPTKVMGYKGAGIRTRVSAVTVASQNLTVRVKAVNGSLTSEQVDAVEDEIAFEVLQTPIGGTLYALNWAAAAKNVEGVVTATAISPNADVVGQPGVKIVPGTITVQVVA